MDMLLTRRPNQHRLSLIKLTLYLQSDDRLPPEREFINDTFDVRNPVIQRLTNNNGALRNESYYKVTELIKRKIYIKMFILVLREIYQ